MKRWLYHYSAQAGDYVFDGILSWTHPIRTMEHYRSAKKMIAGDDYAYLLDRISITSLSLLEVIDDEN